MSSVIDSSSPQTPPLAEFPDYSILSAIGRASHMGLFGGLARAPAIGSLGWYMNMRDSGLTDEEIHQIEEGSYTSSSTTTTSSTPSSDQVAIHIPPPPPLVRVKGFRNYDLEDGDQEEDDSIRNLIAEFNEMSWPSPASSDSTSSSYTNSREINFGNPTQVELNLRNALNAAIDEWNTNVDDCHPTVGITVEELQIRNLKMARYRHLIKASISLLTETFGCHECNDRRTYRGACANCLDERMKGPAESKDFVLSVKLKNN